jgi:AraC family transcriptional regulator, transcriptional activator of pobA
MDRSGERLHVSGNPDQVRRGVAGAGRTLSAVPTVTPAAIGAEVIGSHYAARRWALGSKAARVFSHLLCLHAGGAVQIGGERETIELSGPTIAWLPPGCADYLEVSAGATAALLRLRSGAWHRYLPASAEKAYLALEGAGGILAFPVEPDLATSVSRSVAAIAREIATPARSGAASIVSSELTLCVLRFWRLLASDSQSEEEGGSAEILGRFRRLLEERYHQQLRVVDYAGLLSVTPDRLHALCSRELKRSPSALIQQRVIKEAAARLETSSATVKQIAFALGFKDTAYFNRFFTKHIGEAPGAWRRRVAARGGTGRSKPTLNFADWP